MDWIVFGIGIGIGSFLTSLYWKHFKKIPELDAEMCADYLKKKGYYVNINIVPDKK